MKEKKYSKFDNFQFWLLISALTVSIFVMGYFTAIEIMEHKANNNNAPKETTCEVITLKEYTRESTEEIATQTIGQTIEESIKEMTKATTEEQSESRLLSLGKFKTTAYCSCYTCCGKSDGITATGTKATAGRTIAVDPNVIPYGTEIIINGHTYVAEDCGGAIKGNFIDIYFDTHEQALNYGVKYVEVFQECGN